VSQINDMVVFSFNKTKLLISLIVVSSMKQLNFPHFLAINAYSIKKLSILGFSLVALPLVIALLYSANQISLLSHQSTSAIFNVAELVKTNRQINFTLAKMERSASQFLILKDQDLLTAYLRHEQAILKAMASNPLFNKDNNLNRLSKEFSQAIKLVHRYLTLHPLETSSLASLQVHFTELVSIRKKIAEQSNNLLISQAEQIKASANDVRHDMLKSLMIIPFTLIIAAIFIFLITKPLKQLLKKIHHLALGNFDSEVTFNGSPEMKEIADALEVMRNRLHALELQKSSFIRHISHELKTPLAAIREGTELLYDHSVGELNAEQQEISNIIRSSVTRLQRLIEDLLDFNIVLDSTSLQDAETVELSLLVDQVLQQRSLDIKQKNLTVVYKSAAIKLKANGKQLSVILDNLLSNAIKYSDENNVINIVCSLNDNTLLLSIIDQGIGIANGQQEKIFDAFYQGIPAKNAKIKGSGLGLTIVKELLMRLNGTIELKSNTGINSGTSMTITLPHAFLVETKMGVKA
jgi:two-component system sensor histidine kinase GlrK